MIVEDNELILDVCNNIISSKGYKTIIALNPDDALNNIINSKQHIDLLLTDIVMPGMNGNELYKQMIKKNS